MDKHHTFSQVCFDWPTFYSFWLINRIVFIVGLDIDKELLVAQNGFIIWNFQYTRLIIVRTWSIDNWRIVINSTELELCIFKWVSIKRTYLTCPILVKVICSAMSAPIIFNSFIFDTMYTMHTIICLIFCSG